MNEDKRNAIEYDLADKLARFKDQFVNTDDVIYLDGNSLGKLPKKTLESQQELVKQQWGNRLIRGWNEGWIEMGSRIGAKIASLVGAQPDEIFVGDTTSIHLYKLAFAALTYQKNRTEILTDDLNFPSDLYVLQGLISNHFPNHNLTIIPSTGNEMSIKSIEEKLTSNASLLTLSHVAYKSSFLYPMKKINELAHKKDCLVLWDLSHSVGAVPIDLNKSKADMAVGCTYKYLNGGPGSPAFLYVRKDLQSTLKNPIWSWFSHVRPFDFQNEYQPSPFINKFAISTPSILSMAAIEPGVELLLEAGMSNIRNKSEAQSEFLVHLIEKYLLPLGFQIASPTKIAFRGSHISITHTEAYRINRAMIAPKGSHRMVIPDFRPPNNIRLGIAPLYTSYVDLFDAIIRIRDIVLTKEFEGFNHDQELVP